MMWARNKLSNELLQSSKNYKNLVNEIKEERVRTVNK